MSLNFDKYSIEKRHDKRFLGIFLMFAVIAVVIGFMGVFSVASMSGYGLFDFLKAPAPSPTPTPVALGNVANCTDSDGGIVPYVKGIVSYNGTSYTDFCWKNGTNVTNATALAEFYCWKDYPSRTLIYCPSGCSNGACLNVTNMTDTSPGVELPGAGLYQTAGGYGACYCPVPGGWEVASDCSQPNMTFCAETTCTITHEGVPDPVQIQCKNSGMVNAW